MEEIPRHTKAEIAWKIFNIQLSDKNCLFIAEQIILYNNKKMLMNE